MMRAAKSGEQGQRTAEDGTSQRIVQQMMDFANSIIEAAREDDSEKKDGPRFPI